MEIVSDIASKNLSSDENIKYFYHEDLVCRCILAKETKTFSMLGEVGMANESTKTTQTSVRMAEHN